MSPDQAIHDLHELHEERIALVVRYKNLQHKQATIDRKQAWLIVGWLVGIVLAGIALANSSQPFVYRPIEQQVFWAVVVLVAIVWTTISWRHLSKEELQNVQQVAEASRGLDHLEDRLRSFEPPLRISRSWLVDLAISK